VTEPTTELTTEPASEPTLGELVQRASKDMSELMRKEVQLAKLEIRTDAVAAAKGVGALGGAGVTGLLCLVFLSAGAAFGIGEALGTWAGFVIVGGVYLLLAAVLALLGRNSVRRVGPPTKTVETVKDDLTWARHPTRTAEDTLPIS
jgi:hypothetical protein